jgi:DNA-binding PadR family transcriptional regulator
MPKEAPHRDWIELLQVDTGSLYPALHRLEREVSVISQWEASENGQRVKVYSRSAAGKRHLADECSRRGISPGASHAS